MAAHRLPRFDQRPTTGRFRRFSAGFILGGNDRFLQDEPVSAASSKVALGVESRSSHMTLDGGTPITEAGSSLAVGGIEPVGEAQASGPILAALQEIASIQELAVGVFA